jgi:lipoate synthase
MNTHNIDICALSKTKKKGKVSAKYQNCILLYSVIEKNNRTVTNVGILVGIHQKFENIIDEVEYINKNIIHLTLKTNTGRIPFFKDICSKYK